MPYEIKKVPGGFKVGKENSRRTFSSHPLTKEKAIAQMRALYLKSPK
jgi:hypothetical protein